ncbi:MAG: hypothetical protein H7343_21995 [Undibacterium sp.]|nr:hypothetical protein [Opitutaceae bacterium]
MNYGLSVERTALTRLLEELPSAQWRLFDLFSTVADRPFSAPDLSLRRSGGAVIDVRVFGDTLIHYHVDHAVKTVIILDYELVTAD